MITGYQARPINEKDASPNCTGLGIFLLLRVWQTIDHYA
jgi:hypothetical protein